MTDFKLPRQFGQKWVDALRSGAFQQGKEKLYNKETDQYCCLGVAGCICGIDELSMDRQGFVYSISDNGTDIPEERLAEEAHERQYPNELLYNHKADSLASKLSEINDDGETFDYIADWVEKNVEFYD